MYSFNVVKLLPKRSYKCQGTFVFATGEEKAEKVTEHCWHGDTDLEIRGKSE